MAMNGCMCGEGDFELVHTYREPPLGEARFPGTAGNYRRELLRCRVCGHFVSRHTMDLTALYEGDYVTATYGDAEGMRRSYERVLGLPQDESDNRGRVKFVLETSQSIFPLARFTDRAPAVLDVGSGLCVFLHEMKKAGWDCTALDPDPRAVRHARDVVGVRAVEGDFRRAEGLVPVDVVTLNKVLEHLEDPIEMLARVKPLLLPGGWAYVELPDGAAAFAEGPGREEFFIDHWHVFSPASLAHLAERAGFVVRAVHRLREPSTKFTLRGVLTS